MNTVTRRVLCLTLALGAAAVRADDRVDFFRAVNVDNASAVAALLARGFDPNTLDDKGQVALFLALRDDSPKVAAVLLAHPQTRVDAANASNETPLMIAALRGVTAAVPRLLERGAQLDRPGWSPLHYAATGPEPKMVALLLDRGARVEALSPNRSTPLMMAARYGAHESVPLLLNRGADPRARNDAGLTAADFARLAGREPVEQRLEQAAR